jgi:methyl-accepting chemotaxis protein
MGGPGENKWYNLFIGILWGISGKSEKDFEKTMSCLPTEWQAADPKPVAEESKKSEPKSTWTKILDGVQEVIGFVCNWKKNIKDLFGKRIRRQQRRNKYRMLVQTYSSRMARYRRALGWWDDIKNAAKKALGAVTDWAKAKWEDLKNFGNDFIKNIALFWDNLKAKVVAFLNSDFVKFIKKFYECVMAAKGIVEAIVKVIKATVERVTQIATIAAGNLPELAKLFVDLICNFKDFREAINNLIDGIEEKETNKKYGLYGRFFGIFFKALTAKKMRRFRLKH